MSDSKSEIDETKTGRRRLLFWIPLSLTLIVICTAIYLPFQNQIRMIDRIEDRGGEVATDPIGPEWLRNLIGHDRMRGLENLTEISVSG
ncbi:MAG TPA: hypothetical protein VLA12_04185, partial [Planctomycetaceae bacterium]|nr:hypothetical protein [Planctomycetaceae bacterium]